MEQKGSKQEQMPDWLEQPEAQLSFKKTWRKIALINLVEKAIVPIAGLFCGAAVGFVVDYLNSTFYIYTILIGVIGLVMGRAALDQENDRQKRLWNSLSEDQRTEHIISEMQKQRKK